MSKLIHTTRQSATNDQWRFKLQEWRFLDENLLQNGTKDFDILNIFIHNAALVPQLLHIHVHLCHTQSPHHETNSDILLPQIC